MLWKQFTHLGNFPPELKARFNSFLTTEFDDSLSVEMQLRSIIKWCQGNFKTVDTLIDFINDISNWLKQFENNFDTKLEDSVISVLSEWQANGKLDDIINEALQWQLDDYIATNEQDKLSLTAQLQQTNTRVTSVENNKRDKSVKLINTDLDTSTDSKKLKLVNLADEVVQSITGNAPVNNVIGDGTVSNTKLADGSVGTTKYADKSITGAKLSTNYSFKKTLITEDLNTLTDSGMYYTESALPNKPSNTGNIALIKVENLTAGYVIQTYMDATNQETTYRRIMRTGWFTGAWKRVYVGELNNTITNAMLQNASVTSEKLGDNPLTKADLTNNTDFDNVTKEGRYLGIGTNIYINIPSELAGKTVFLDVKPYGFSSGGFVIQEITEYQEAMNVYRRYVRAGVSATPWEKLNISSTVRTTALTGKNIACFGDSITGNFNYPSKLANYLGANVFNVGFGGTRMAIHGEGTGLVEYYDKFCMHSLAEAIKTGDYSAQDAAVDPLSAEGGPSFHVNLDRLKSIDFNTIDYLTIFYGTNDFASLNVPIGQNTDMDKTTFKGAINISIKKIMETYPHIKIAFITPMYRSRYDSGDGKDSDLHPNLQGIYLKDYADAIKEVANLNHLPVLDMYREGGVNKYNATTFLGDGLHPSSPVGEQHIANKIGAFLVSQF